MTVDTRSDPRESASISTPIECSVRFHPLLSPTVVSIDRGNQLNEPLEHADDRSVSRWLVTWRWLFGIAIVPLVFSGLCVLHFLTTPGQFHAPSVVLAITLVYLTQPLWMWLVTGDEDLLEERRTLLADTTIAILPAATTAVTAWAWLRFSSLSGGADVSIADEPGEGWRRLYLMLPFLIPLAGAAIALLREQRRPLTLGAVLALPITAPLIWLLALAPAS